MLISPPFLPPFAPQASATGSGPARVREARAIEDAWLNLAMSCGAVGDGAFLASRNLAWHGGVHMQAPLNAAGMPEAVRAIMDGRIIYMRQPRPASSATGPTDPQNAYGGWTDNGCVVLEHKTEIGHGSNASVTFYSVYMHLSALAKSVAKGARIYRKDVIGTAGRISGLAPYIQFEIVCDDLNLGRLVGRTEGMR